MTQEIEWISSAAWAMFLKTNQNENPHKLLLKYGSSAPEIRFFAEQVAARQKAKGKWNAEWFSEKIIFPPPLSVEQSSSSETAFFKSKLVTKGSRGIDITGGFGLDSHALSKVFKHWIYVEQNALLSTIAQHNFKVLGCDNIEVVCANGPETVLQLSDPLDLIFADPARRLSGRKAIKTQTYEPDLTKYHEKLRLIAHELLYKLSPMADIHEQRQLFFGEFNALVLEFKRECKELLLFWSPSCSEITQAYSLDFSHQTPLFEGSQRDENNARVTFSAPQKYLFEPSIAVMKTGLFNSLSQKFSINKLHNDSHLYTSDSFVKDFPGRKFEILESGALGKLKIPRVGVRIASRNHPLKPEEIRKKLKLKDGTDLTLFATTLQPKERIGILTKELDI